MSIDVLRDVLARRPFEPFRIILSSGDFYEVRHPENALLVRSGMYVAQHDNGDLPERAIFCSLPHILPSKRPPSEMRPPSRKRTDCPWSIHKYTAN